MICTRNELTIYCTVTPSGSGYHLLAERFCGCALALLPFW